MLFRLPCAIVAPLLGFAQLAKHAQEGCRRACVVLRLLPAYVELENFTPFFLYVRFGDAC